MDSDDDNDNRVLHIIPSKELRLIPLYVIITHIYDKIIEKASECEFTYTFFIDQLIKDYKIKTKIATPGNKMLIINEIKRLFPGIKITEIVAPSYFPYNSYWSASWEEETEELNNCQVDDADGANFETDNDDIMLNQAIQLSLNEVKVPEKTNNSNSSNSSIMGEKAEERLQKSRQKYKKLYN